MSLERFINKELTHAAERTTARFITGVKGATGKLVEGMVKPDTQEGLALVRQRFTEHALARI